MKTENNFFTRRISIKYKPKILELSDGNVFFFHPELPRFIKTSFVGKAIFELIAQERVSLEEILRIISNRYCVPKRVIQNSVCHLVKSFISLDFMQIDNDMESIENHDKVKIISKKLDELWINESAITDSPCKDKIVEKILLIPTKSIIISTTSSTLNAKNVRILEHLKHKISAEINLVVPEIVDSTIIYECCKYINKISVFTEECNPDNISFGKLARLFLQIKSSADIERCAILKVSPHNADDFKRPENFYLLNASSLSFANTHTLPLHQNLWTINANYDPFFKESINIYRDFLKRHSLFLEKAKAIKDFEPLKISMQFDPVYRLMRRLNDGGCEAGTKRLYIDSNGDIFACPALRELSDSYIGNILTDHANSIINEGEKWSEKIFTEIKKDKECQMCVFLLFCRGGCRYFGRIRQKDAYCSDLKTLYISALQNVSVFKY